MNKKIASALLTVIILLIITIPSFNILLNNQYPSMHDDQHIARLYLLDQGIKQGSWYPRWVGGLGFGFGYPLYNFYPPFIYYLAEIFHLVGFSYLWSIKLVIIFGFILCALGIYWFIRELIGRWSAILGAVIYTYFFYHAVVIYVRGALAEFLTLVILPFLFLFLTRLSKKPTLKNSLLFAVFFALLILTHPLIAFPSLFFIGFGGLFYLITTKEKRQFIKFFSFGFLMGLLLSSFFWLPSIVERKHTLVDEILTKELANYKDHYIYPQQFWYSPWGYGGSVEGVGDGLTFQLGKVHIGLVIGAVMLSVVLIAATMLSFRTMSYGVRNPAKRNLRHDLIGTRFLANARNDISTFYLFVFLLLFSLFMSTEYSSFIWDNIRYLWYLQFPWRFLTFTAFFGSVVGGYSIFFLERFLTKKVVVIGVIIITVITVIKYRQYFRPQQLLETNNSERTSFKEIAWRISSTSYEFVPKGVKTKKTAYGTTTLAIEEKDLPKKPYVIISGRAKVKIEKNKFDEKVFTVAAATPIQFRLNTYYFPGWTAQAGARNLKIDDQNDLKLITVSLPKGHHRLRFQFTDTPVRKLGNAVSLISLIFISALLVQTSKWPTCQRVFRIF